jgi:hypothetical protein
VNEVAQLKPDPLEEARQLLKGEQEGREKRCLESVQQLLAEHRCTLTVYLNRTPEGAFVPVVGIQALST